ncbi:MAG: C25 family cysteine peptidase [Fibrobacterales bacterium]
MFFLLFFLASTLSANEQWRGVASLIEPDNAPAIKVNVKQTENSIRLKYILPQAQVKKLLKKHNGTALSDLHIGNAQLMQQPGEPILPAIPVSVALPKGKEVKSITVQRSGKNEFNEYIELNHGSQAVDVSLTNVKGKTPRLNRIYESDDSFPSRAYSPYSIENKRGVSLAVFTLYPAMYKPLSGKVTSFKNITVLIELQDKTTAAPLLAGRSVPHQLSTFVDEQTMEDFIVENREALETFSEPQIPNAESTVIPYASALVNPMESYKYIIITNQEIYNSTQTYTIHNFAAKKTLKGYPTKIVTVEDIYANYTGVDNQEQIRNFLIDAYNTWGITYVLLAGDVNVVPARLLTPETGVSFASDMYYQCLGGTYDYNNNGSYGETDDGEYGGLPDLFSEFSIGRTPAANPWEMSNWVYKHVHFDIMPNSDFYNNVHTVGEYLGEAFGVGIFQYSRVGLTTLMEGSSALGINTMGLNQRYATSYLSDYETPWNASTIINSINNNEYGQYHHIGHGNSYLLMKMVLDDERSLTNHSFPFLYSVSCKTGDFTQDCVGERMMTSEPSGFLAAVLNTHNGLGYRNDDIATYDGPSHRLHRHFVDKNVEHPFMELGRVNAYSVESSSWLAGMGDISALKVMYMSTLFGDPALRLPVDGQPAVLRSGVQVVSDINGNNDGVWNPHEELTIETMVSNTGSMNALGVTAEINFIDPCIQYIRKSISVGDVPPGSGFRPLEKFIINTSTCSEQVPHNYSISYTDGTQTWVHNSGSISIYQAARFHGLVRDGYTKAPFAHTEITYSNTFDFMETITTDANGRFDIQLIADDMNVKIYSAGYKSINRDFLLSSTGEEQVFELYVPRDIALNKTASASSVEGNFTADLAIDGNSTTRWSSEFNQYEQITVDLEGQFDITKLVLNWEGAYADQFSIYISIDGIIWKPAGFIHGGLPGRAEYPLSYDDITHVRINGVKRGTEYGYSLYDLEVHGVPAEPKPPKYTYLDVPDMTINFGEFQEIPYQTLDQYHNPFPISTPVNLSMTGGYPCADYDNANGFTAKYHEATCTVTVAHSGASTTFTLTIVDPTKNMIQNGDFTNGSDHWQTEGTNGNEKIIFSNHDDIDVTYDPSGQETDEGSLQFYQVVSVVEGQEYDLSFDARATGNSSGRRLYVNIQQAESPWEKQLPQYLAFELHGQPNKKAYTTHFTATRTEQVKIAFFGATNDDKCYIDNIVLKQRGALQPRFLDRIEVQDLTLDMGQTGHATTIAYDQYDEVYGIGPVTYSSPGASYGPFSTLIADKGAGVFELTGTYVTSDNTFTHVAVLTVIDPSGPGPNLIVDGTFNSPQEYWEIQGSNGTIAFTPSHDDGDITYDPSGDASNPWDLQFYQEVNITAGLNYELTFDARATGNSDGRTLYVNIQQAESPWESHLEEVLEFDLIGESNKREYSGIFTATTTETVKVAFFGATSSVKCYIDNVELRTTTTLPPPPPPTPYLDRIEVEDMTLSTGETGSIIAIGYDQYGEEHPIPGPPIIWAPGAYVVNSYTITALDTLGDYTLTVRDREGIVTGTATLTVSNTSEPGPNIIVNGDFEDQGNLSVWTLYGNGSNGESKSGEVKIAAHDEKAGDSFDVMYDPWSTSPADWSVQIYQEIEVEIGKTYNYSFNSRVTGYGSRSIDVAVQHYSSFEEYDRTSHPISGPETNYTGTFTVAHANVAPNEVIPDKPGFVNVKFTFMDATDGTKCYFDDIEVHQAQ